MDNGNKKTEEKRLSPLFVFTAGLFAPLIATSLARITGLFNTGWQFLIIGLVYGGIAFYITVRSQNRFVARLAIIYAMIPFGVILDAAFDFFIHHYDRNLWPIEVVISLLFLLFPLALGALAGRFVARRRSR